MTDSIPESNLPDEISLNPGENPPIPEIHKDKPKSIYVLTAILTAGLVCAGVVLYLKFAGDKTNIPQTPISAPAPVTKDPGEWVTYTDPEATISFRYPSGWEMREYENGGRITVENGESYFFSVELNIESPVGLGDVSDPEVIIENYLNYYSSSTSQFLTHGKIVSREETVVGGFEAKKYILEEADPERAGVRGSKTWIFVPNNGRVTYIMMGNTGADTAVTDRILATLTLAKSSPSPTRTETNNYAPGPAWHRVTHTGIGLTFCLPPKWDFRKNGDGSDSGSLVYYRDAGYAPDITLIESVPYTSGSRREAYFAYWKTEYPDIRERVSGKEIPINGSSALLFSPIPEENPKYSPEGLTVVWLAQGKLWKAGVSGWRSINDSQTAFLKDFYTVIGCTF